MQFFYDNAFVKKIQPCDKLKFYNDTHVSQK